MRKSEITFYPKLSLFLLGYLTLVHAFAAICVYVSICGQWLYLLFFVLLIVGIFYFCHIAGVLSNRSIYSLEYLSDRRWRLSMADGEIRDVELQGKSVLTLID